MNGLLLVLSPSVIRKHGSILYSADADPLLHQGAVIEVRLCSNITNLSGAGGWSATEHLRLKRPDRFARPLVPHLRSGGVSPRRRTKG